MSNLFSINIDETKTVLALAYYLTIQNSLQWKVGVTVFKNSIFVCVNIFVKLVIDFFLKKRIEMFPQIIRIKSSERG